MAREDAHKLVRKLFFQTLSHLQPEPRMRQMLCLRHGLLEIAGEHVALPRRGPVRVVSIGKAASQMTAALAEITTGVRLKGVVAGPGIQAAIPEAVSQAIPHPTPPAQVPGLDYFAGGHPYPNEQSWRAAEAALALLNRNNVNSGVWEDELVIFLISGGGSSLMELPVSPETTSLQDVRRLYELLVTCGASIGEINTVRKHYSSVKGGRLAERAWPARQVTVYISDVPEDLPSMVASGPSMPDETTISDIDRILAKYDLISKLPASYRGAPAETPKPGDRCFEQSRYYCVLSNRTALEMLLECASSHGIIVVSEMRCDDWDYRKAADYLLKELAELARQHPAKTVAVISGGELSCPVTGAGLGGRNQAFVLDCIPKIAGKRIIVLSGGTDGVDGNSPACGALADGESLARACALQLDVHEFLARSDSYHFFERLGDVLIAGPTGTNVRDLRILLAYPA